MADWNNEFRKINEMGDTLIGIMEAFQEKAINNSISDKYKGEVLQFIGECYEIADRADEGLFGDNINNIRECILSLQNCVAENDIHILGQCVSEFRTYINATKDYASRLEMTAKIFENDSSAMNLQDEKLKMCQGLVDMDLRIYGSISPDTLQILEVQNLIVVDNHVEEKKVEENTLPADDKQIVTQEQFDELLEEHRSADTTLQLNGKRFKGVSFSGNLSNISFNGAEFIECQFYDVEMNNVRLSQTVFEKTDIDNCRFRDCNMRVAEFIETSVMGSDFYNTDCTNIKLTNSKVNDSTFVNVDMSQGTINNSFMGNNYYAEDFVAPETLLLPGATMEEEKLWVAELQKEFHMHFFYKLKDSSVHIDSISETNPSAGDFSFVLQVEQEGGVVDEIRVSGEFSLDLYGHNFVAFDTLPKEYAVAGRILYRDVLNQLSNLPQLENEKVVRELKTFVEQHKETMEEIKKGEKGTLIVNAYAGPGAGKTTACLAAVAELKKMGYVAEYVSEYAKELVYDNPELLNGTTLNQYSILTEQTHRLDRFVGKVDIIVTDSPILLNTIYGKDLPKEYALYVKQLYDQYENFNFFVQRGEDFQQEGRVQNKEESVRKDNEIEDLLKGNDLFFGRYNHKTVNNLAKKIDVTYNRLFGEKEEQIQQKEEDKMSNEIPKDARAYKGSYYEKSVGEKKSKEHAVYGNSPEQIIEKIRAFNRGRAADMHISACYIRKLNKEIDRYENPAKYEVATGLDITPIYLNLPHLPRTEYMKVINKIKEDGAKFNRVQKRFYVTKQADLNLFRDYLPIAGTQAEIGENRSRNELPYEVEPGSDYYDNRVKITIKGMEPINIYGDSFDVHFPSLSMDETREIVEKFVLPGLEPVQSKPVQKQVEYNGKTYDNKQYDVIQKAISQHFTKEQLQLLERPDLTSDRLNEVRFAIKDGLSAEQIAQFATPEHEQWQMDLCRIGMQHGFSYNDLQGIIESKNYNKELWGERRNMLAKMIKEKDHSKRPSVLGKLRENEKAVAARTEGVTERGSLEKARNTQTCEK